MKTKVFKNLFTAKKIYQTGFKHGKTFTKKADPSVKVFLGVTGGASVGYGIGHVKGRRSRKKRDQKIFSLGYSIGKQTRGK